MFTSIMGEYYYFAPATLSCRISHDLGSSNVLLVLAALFFLLPLFIILLFNGIVYWNSAKKSGRSVRQRDNIRTMFAVCTVNAICYLPVTIASMYQTEREVAPWVQLAAQQVFYVSTYVNPLLYLTLSSGFRRFLAKGRHKERSQEGANPVNAVVTQPKATPRVSTAEELKPVPTASTMSPPIETPKGVFARAYAQALRKTSVSNEHDENWEYYFAS